MLQYHRAAIEMLPAPPVFSPKNADTIAEREKQLRRVLPASVREWYSLDRSIDLLREYSNCDSPIDLDQLGAPAEDWYGSGPRDFLKDDLLWIMTENQGVCNWAVQLDGTDDPPVMVEVDSAPNENWCKLASSFSEFIYCQIWDHPQDVAQCGAQESDLAATDLELLQRHFKSGPTTSAWPGSINRRFTSADGRILIWFAEDHGADWFLYANSAEQMERLIRSVWKCGNLASTLYGNDEAAERALARVRAAGK